MNFFGKDFLKKALPKTPSQKLFGKKRTEKVQI